MLESRGNKEKDPINIAIVSISYGLYYESWRAYSTCLKEISLCKIWNVRQHEGHCL